MATATAKMVISGEDRTKKAFNSVQNSLKGLDKSFGSLKAGLGAVVGVAGIGAFISQMTETADKIGKVSSKLGISTDALQKFRYGAEQSGVSASTFDMAIQRMTRRVAEAREGTGEAKKALKEMGIVLTDSSGKAKTTEQVFLEVADKMKGMGSQSDKVRLAFKLFDSEGVSLVNMLQNGSEAIKGYGDELERYGGIIDNRAIKASENFGDALNLLSKSSAVVFTPLIIGLNRVMETFTAWINYFQGVEGVDPFNLANKTSEELTKRMKFLNRLGEKAHKAQIKALGVEKSLTQKAKEIVGFKSKEELLQQTIGMSATEILAIQMELNRRKLEETKTEETQLKQKGISLVQQKAFSQNLTQQIGSSKNLNKLVKAQTEEQKKQKKVVKDQLKDWIKTEEQISETEKTWTAIIQDINGAEVAVSGLTREQKQLLEEANKTTRMQELYAEVVGKSAEAHKDVLDEIEEQKNKNKELIEQQQTLIGWVGGFSNTFSAILKSINFKTDETTGKIKMTGFNWQEFGLSILMKSPKIQKSMEMLFGFVDKAVDGLIPGLQDTSKEASEMAKRAKEIKAEVESMTATIDDYALAIKNSTSEMQALANIEKTYQDRVKKANELDADHLLYYAQIEKDLGILAYRVGVLRSATQAFASSVTQFLDAVATEGFTEIQKRFFSMLTGFERGTKKAYGNIIEEADKIIKSTPIDPENLKKAFVDIQSVMSKQLAGDFTGENMQQVLDRYGITQADTPIEGMFNEIQTFLNKGGAGAQTPEVIKQIMEKYTGVLEAGITGMDAKIDAFNKAVKAKTDAEAMLPEALKGLVIMLKDVMRTEFESGASKEQLKLDIDALSASFKGLGIDADALKTFVDTLKKLDPEGAMGGLVKRYPYGGTIQGPSHSGGGVGANLEGGEYVMRKSAVSQYGQDFMNAINTGSFSMGKGVEVSIYDGTGQAIDEYDSTIRVEINQRANRFNQFPALPN